MHLCFLLITLVPDVLYSCWHLSNGGGTALVFLFFSFDFHFTWFYLFCSCFVIFMTDASLFSVDDTVQESWPCPHVGHPLLPEWRRACKCPRTRQPYPNPPTPPLLHQWEMFWRWFLIELMKHADLKTNAKIIVITEVILNKINHSGSHPSKKGLISSHNPPTLPNSRDELITEAKNY